MPAGPRNLITDVPGILVGNAQDMALRSGVSVLTAARPFVAGVHVMGGAPGTRETDALAPDRLVQEADALVLSGGSAFGLSAASGVADALRAQGRGFDVGGQKVPIVPAAILFDLLNGGDKGWDENPYAALGAAALGAASDDFALGTAGAGTGATTAGLMGGLGSASEVLPSGHTVGALVAVNALGSATVGEGPHFWAAPFEVGDEFSGLGPAPSYPTEHPTKLAAHREATTIAIVATDAALTQAQATRMAIAAHDGMARALVPSHTPFDGDLVFAAATGTKPLADPLTDLLTLGHAASTALARAIARGVYLATDDGGAPLPTWCARHAN
ncbi:Peptidase, T4 family [Candidatus Rhodobacter oscarellae]|uniref:Peptidase, T4 family n=1 Tax=Candidatus Rhodobacter oscarellae TaxID=1675527 RepID=A0A0J9EC40_9RHOB|nr:P1 family peptidase [Candidatus Rhodobacter lobularis]KMW60340.1 Peptidase, T4 family [Candidatus Rhodobacter lobularis]